MRVNDNQQRRGSNESMVGSADFEAAIQACGFGIFNICLILVVIPALAATAFETTTMSYILASAECDLHLSLMYKGILNGITYLGMIASAIPWGFIADTMGRKKVLVFGLTIEGILVLGTAMTQNFHILLACKFLSGLMICGPIAVLMSYIAEFHGRRHRATVMMLIGTLKALSLLVLAIMAYFMLPYHWESHFSGMRFHTWQYFIAATAIPSLISGSLLSLFPESPKFLMTQGRNAEALATFQLIYTLNTGQDRNSFPVSTLISFSANETSGTSRGKNRRPSFTEGVHQLKPMFSFPFLQWSILAYTMNFFIMAGVNSIRLWLPQIFASIIEYETKYSHETSICGVLEYNVNRTRYIHRENSEDCDVHVAADSYTNNIIVACASLGGFGLTFFLVMKISNKVILIISLCLSSITGGGLYWSTSSTSIVILSSLFITFCGIANTAVLNVSIEIFPTAMRTMVLVIIMTCGRFGSLIGSILFPLSFAAGCEPPFIMVAIVLLSSCIFSCFLPDNKKIQFQ